MEHWNPNLRELFLIWLSDTSDRIIAHFAPRFIREHAYHKRLEVLRSTFLNENTEAEWLESRDQLRSYFNLPL